MGRVLPFARVGLGALLPSSLTPPPLTAVNLIPVDSPSLAPNVDVIGDPLPPTIAVDEPAPSPRLQPPTSPYVDTMPSGGAVVPYTPPNTTTVTSTGEVLTPSLGVPALPMWAWLAIGAVVWLMLGDSNNRKR